MSANLASKDPTLSLKGLGVDVVPDSLLAPKDTGHLEGLDLKRNSLQLLPSELFLSLNQLQELDISEVWRNKSKHHPDTLNCRRYPFIFRRRIRGALLIDRPS